MTPADALTVVVIPAVLIVFVAFVWMVVIEWRHRR